MTEFFKKFSLNDFININAKTSFQFHKNINDTKNWKEMDLNESFQIKTYSSNEMQNKNIDINEKNRVSEIKFKWDSILKKKCYILSWLELEDQ